MQVPSMEGEAQPLSPISTLKHAYDVIYEKYERAKARKIANQEKLFEEHKLRTVAYAKATESLVETLREENEMYQQLVKESQIEETLVRLKDLEKENALLRNRLLMSEVRDVQSDSTNYKFLQRIFQSVSDMQVSEETDKFVFVHEATGLKFSLEPVADPGIAQICGGDQEVKYTPVSLGSLRYIAPDWMRESITFSVNQAPEFFRRLRNVTTGR